MYIKNGSKKYECTDFSGKSTDDAVIFYTTVEPKLKEDKIELYANGDTAESDFLMRTVKRSDYQFESVEAFGGEFIIKLSDVEDKGPDLNEVKKSKIEDLSRQTQEKITSGVDVDTEDGIEHFSMESHDQQNITSICQYLSEHTEIDSYLYHADGKEFKPYPRSVLFSIRDNMLQSITKHTEEYNNLRSQVYAATSIDDVNNINF